MLSNSNKQNEFKKRFDEKLNYAKIAIEFEENDYWDLWKVLDNLPEFKGLFKEGFDFIFEKKSHVADMKFSWEDLFMNENVKKYLVKLVSTFR